MTARRTRRVDETTVIDLVMKGDYEGLAQLTGVTVDQLERLLDETGREYHALNDDDDGFPVEMDDDWDDDWDKDDEHEDDEHEDDEHEDDEHEDDEHEDDEHGDALA